MLNLLYLPCCPVQQLLLNLRNIMLGKYLNPRNDVAFKRVFGTEKNKDILIAMLNAVVKRHLHQPIVEVRYLPTLLDPDVLAKKQSVVDVLCQDEDGCKYIIEMQVSGKRGFVERAQYYVPKPLSPKR